LQQVINDLQELRGIADISAVTLASWSLYKGSLKPVITQIRVLRYDVWKPGASTSNPTAYLYVYSSWAVPNRVYACDCMSQKFSACSSKSRSRKIEHARA
jgi:hypothetical protein